MKIRSKPSTRSKLRRRVKSFNNNADVESTHSTHPNDTRYIHDSCGSPSARTCISCGIKEQGLNFKLPEPNNPKAFVNLFCSECLSLHTNPKLYKLAIPFYNSTHEPAKLEGGLSEDYRYRRSTPHKHR
jgi:hypothetical protein